MRLKERSISFVVNFLLGIAWAAMLIGAISSFFTNLPHGIFPALLFGMLGMIPGAIAILCIEHFLSVKSQQYELQKQTEILKSLSDSFKNKSHD